MDEKRFKVVKKEASGVMGEVRILLDRETGMQYLYYGLGYGGGLTPLLGPDGKPLPGCREASGDWE